MPSPPPPHSPSAGPPAAPPPFLPADLPPGPLPAAVDAGQFARRGQQLAGRTPIANLTRLQEADVAPSGELDWQVTGEMARDDLERLRPFIALRLRFAPVLTCVRCLEPVAVGSIEVERRFRLAASERQAEIEDRETDAVDVIDGTPPLDLGALIEDEAILALPMAPAHADCTAPAPQTVL